MIFWLIALLMLFVVLGVLTWPLLRPAKQEPAGEDYSLNLTVYRQHLAELESDQESGLLTEEQAGQVRRDIERSLLREIPEGAETAEPAPPKPGSRWPLALIAVVLTAGTLSLYLDLGSPDMVAGGGNGGSTAAPTSVNEMVSRLERRLRTNPDDVEGWLMLARSYMVLGRYGDAVSVMQRLHKKFGDQPVIMIRYAHALAMANGGSFAGRPGKLIRRVLEIEPTSPAALWFAGVAANQQGNYRTAIDYWQKLEPQLSNQGTALQKVRQLISEARNNMQGGGNETGGNKAAQPVAAGGKSIKVHVTLADALQGKVNPKDTLFIFARAPTGLPMPLAVVKRHAGDLPLDIVLDDSLAMSPQHKLSGQQKVDLVARISRSGSVKRQSGDVQGEKDGVPVDGTDTVPLVIDTRIP
jgi:cytochrome c-type biogenesis protein CcmH